MISCLFIVVIEQIIINIIAIVNMFLQNKIEADYSTIYFIVSIIVLIAVIVYDTYKNFDVTEQGRLGTKITRALKKGVIDNDKVEEILEAIDE